MLSSSLLFNMFFAAALRFVRVRFSEDEGIVENLDHLNDNGAGRGEERLACVRRAVWGMLYTDDAGIFTAYCLEIGRELAYMMIVIVRPSNASRFRKRRWGLCCYKHRTLHPRLHLPPSKQQDRQGYKV